jgi:uncharacterized protein
MNGLAWQKVEECMKKAICIAAAIGMGLAMASWPARAQTPAVRKADKPVAAVTAAQTTIPSDQQPTKEQLTKLFQLMRVQDQLDSITKIMPQMMQQSMEEQLKQAQKAHPDVAMTTEQQKAFSKIMDKYMGRVMNLITADEMIADISKIYQKHLSRSDVDGIIAFYGSPAGQHLLDKQAVILQEYMPVIMNRMQDRIQPLTEEMTKDIEGIVKSKK